METSDFVGLDPEQNAFLAHRLRARSDKEAAIAAGLKPERIEGWKSRDTAFMQAYRELNSDGVKLAQRITREDLGLAALAIREGLAATRPIIGRKGVVSYVPDWKERREAAELIFKIHGVLAERVDIEIRVRQMAEQLGLDPETAIAEAQRIIRSGVSLPVAGGGRR